MRRLCIQRRRLRRLQRRHALLIRGPSRCRARFLYLLNNRALPAPAGFARTPFATTLRSLGNSRHANRHRPETGMNAHASLVLLALVSPACALAFQTCLVRIDTRAPRLAHCVAPRCASNPRRHVLSFRASP
jgi:hypothetical protein